MLYWRPRPAMQREPSLGANGAGDVFASRPLETTPPRSRNRGPRIDAGSRWRSFKPAGSLRSCALEGPCNSEVWPLSLDRVRLRRVRRGARQMAIVASVASNTSMPSVFHNDTYDQHGGLVPNIGLRNEDDEIDQAIE